MNAITQTTLCLACPLASNGLVAATAFTAATKAVRVCSISQRTFPTTPTRIPLRSTARNLIQQRRPLHINTICKVNAEHRITIPRSQAGEALQALRGVSLPARRLQSTSVQHTCIKTEPSTSPLCSECKGKIPDSTTKCAETKAEERAKAEIDKGPSTDDVVTGFLSFIFVVLVIFHLTYYFFREDDRTEKIFEELWEEKVGTHRNRDRDRYGRSPDGPQKGDEFGRRVREIVRDMRR